MSPLLSPSWSWVFTELLHVNPLALPRWYLGGVGTGAILPVPVQIIMHTARQEAYSSLLFLFENRLNILQK